MSAAPNTRGAGAWATLVFAAFALLFWTASHDAVRRPAWEIEVDQLDTGGAPRVRAFRDDQDQRLRTPPPLASEVSARTDGRAIEVVVPAAMRTTPSDWTLRLSFSDAARDAGVSGIRIEVDGVVVATEVEAGRKRTLALPASAFGEGPFRIRIAAPAAGAFDGIRIRNHVSLRAWFPSFTVWQVDRPWLRPLADLGLFLLFGAGLGLGAFLLERWASRHGAVAWSERQARRLALPLVTLAAACAGWNLLGSRPIVFGQGSLWLAFAAVVLGAGVVFARGNVEAARTAPRSPAEQERFLDRRRALAIVIALFALYNSNGTRVGMVDGYPPPQMAISLLKEGNLDLDEYRASYRDNQAGVGLVETAEHWVTRWAPGTALFCVPFFVVPVLLGVDAPSVAADMVTKFAMSLLTALSVGILFLALRRVASREAATWWAVAGGLGTAMAHISAQDTWAHGPLGLCLAIALGVALSGRSDARWHAFAGLCIGLAVSARPQGAVLVAPLLLWLASQHGLRIALPYMLGGALPALFLVGFNQYYFGTLSLTHYAEIFGGGWDLPGMPEGFAGQLVSPNRGLFVFSPFLLFALHGAWVGWRDGDRARRTLIAALLAGILAHLLLLSAWRAWHAIFSYGSRYGADLIPYLAVLGAFGWASLRARVPAWRSFQAAVALSIGIHALALYWDLWPWNEYVEKERGVRVSDFEAAAWETRDPQIWFQLRLALGIEDD